MSSFSKSSIKQATSSGSFEDLRKLISDLASRVSTLESDRVKEVESTGSGNAVTSSSKSGTKLTLTKGKTFSESGHTHNYAGSSSAGGPANSVRSELSIQLNGGTATKYNGSAAQSLNITPSSIGAAASSHSHDYLPLSGGTLSGSINTAGDSNGFITHSDEFNVCSNYTGSSGVFWFNYRGIPSEKSITEYKFSNGNGPTLANIAAANIYDNGHRVYSPNNIPSLSTLGAAASDHTHSQYASSSHTHSNSSSIGGPYALSYHTHSQYAPSSHRHTITKKYLHSITFVNSYRWYRALIVYDYKVSIDKSYFNGYVSSLPEGTAKGMLFSLLTTGEWLMVTSARFYMQNELNGPYGVTDIETTSGKTKIRTIQDQSAEEEVLEITESTFSYLVLKDLKVFEFVTNIS